MRWLPAAVGTGPGRGGALIEQQDLAEVTNASLSRLSDLFKRLEGRGALAATRTG